MKFLLNKHRLFLLFFLSMALYGKAQEQTKNIVKISYTSNPVSQYQMTEILMQSTATKASLYDFLKGITDYYSLYINLKDRSSVYVLDSTIHIKPRGHANSRAALADSVLSTVKTAQGKTLKHEWIMEQTFFSEGKVGDIQWELSSKSKSIAGLNCFKAIAKNFPMLTVWYTKDLPLSNGPSIYQGLPGLVIWAEDYTHTTQLLKITYSNDLEGFNKLYKTKHDRFQKEKQRGKHYDKEPVLMIKKGDLHKSVYKYFHKKPYKRQ
ncbi:MAG: GLPGLI family protein [Tenacibaculum sp.]